MSVRIPARPNDSQAASSTGLCGYGNPQRNPCCSALLGVQVDAELVDGRLLPGAPLHNPQMHRAGAENPERQPAGTGRSPWLGRPLVAVVCLLQRSGVDLGMPAVTGRRVFCQDDAQFLTDPGGSAAAGI